MNIVVAVNAPSRHLFPLFQKWSEFGHKVLVIVGTPIGRLGDIQTYTRQGVEVHVLSGPFSRRPMRMGLSAPHLVRRLCNSDALVVGGYATRAALVALALPKRLRPPTVLMAERPDPRTSGLRRILRDSLAKWAVKRAGAVWAMSAAGKKTFEAYGGKVTLLAPYPMPVEALNQSTADPSSNDPISIAVIGSLDERKNPLAAARAFQLLNDWDVAFSATFYGDGPLRGEIENAVAGLPVRVAGHVVSSEIDEALAHTDLLLHTCVYDGWGMVVAEAVEAGVAVVAGQETDSAVEFARLGETVRIVELTPETIANEVVQLATLVRTAEGQASLHQTRSAAREFAGLESLAQRTLADLTMRVDA